MDKELKERLDAIEKKLDEILLRLPYHYVWDPQTGTDGDATADNKPYTIKYGHESNP